MTDIIQPMQLASYLRVPWDESMQLVVDLANGIVAEVYTSAGRTIPDPVPTRALAITLEVAARPIRNPNGYSSESIDDYTYRRDADSRAAGVYLTQSEREELLGMGITRPRGSFYSIGLANPLDIQ